NLSHVSDLIFLLRLGEGALKRRVRGWQIKMSVSQVFTKNERDTPKNQRIVTNFNAAVERW
ncbi:MAG: hypothetical protein AAF902_06140, partial [Chloroflexota bacterium]